MRNFNKINLLQPGTRSSGFTLVEILVVAAIMALLAAIAIPNFQQYLVSTKVTKARTEMGEVGKALQAYFIDHNEFPAVDHSDPNLGGFGVNRRVGNRSQQLERMPTFRERVNDEDELATLIHPEAYMSQYPEDPFASSSGATYSYSTPDETTLGIGSVRRGWILWSFGPDTDERTGDYGGYGGDIELVGVPNAPRVHPDFYNPRTFLPQDPLVEAQYDPTNGLRSDGDVFMIKQ